MVSNITRPNSHSRRFSSQSKRRRQEQSKGLYDLAQDSRNPAKAAGSLEGRLTEKMGSRGGNGSQKRQPGGKR